MAASLGRRSRPGGAALPLLLILAGVVLLLRNVGVLPPAWSSLEHLWPLALVVLGVDLVVGGRVSWPVQLVTTAAVLILGVGVLLGLQVMRSVAPGVPAAPRTSLDQPLEGATRATVHVAFGAGAFAVGALPDPGERLATAVLQNGGGARIDSRYRVDRGTGDLNLSVGGEGAGWIPPFLTTGGRSAAMDLRLSPNVPLALDAKLGAADSRLDLSALKLSRLDLQTGASSVWVRLPEAAGLTSGRIQVGAASATIEVPAGVAAQIDYQGGVSSLDVDQGRFPLIGEGIRGAQAMPVPPASPTAPSKPGPLAPPKPPAPLLGGSRLYRSPDYDTAANKIDLVVESGASSVTIR
jgi:hypothetical protein